MKSDKKHIFFCLSVILFTTVCFFGDLKADGTGIKGYNQQLFRPQTDGYGLFNVSGSKVLPHLKFSAGFVANVSKNNVNVDMPARLSSIRLIDTDVAGDFNAALGLFNFMDVGLNVPVVFYEQGTNYDTLQDYTASALGDMRLDVKFNLLDDKKGSIGLALMSVAGFPTGSRYKFTGDDGPTWEGRLVLDKTIKRVSFFVNAGYRFRKEEQILLTQLDNNLTFGGGSSFRLPFDGDRWLLTAEITGEAVAKNIEKNTTPTEVWGGIRREFDSGMSLNFGGGRRIFNAIGASDLRLFAGISFSLARRDEAIERKKATVKGEIVSIKQNVYFAFDKAKIDAKDYQVLEGLVSALHDNMEQKVELSGYTDNVGTKAYNKGLSMKRAMSVKDFLIKNGIQADRIIVKAFGEDNPAESNSSRSGRSKNRRVEISLN
ncbi:MAG: hypothetical protein COV46_08475 [Deltaproteobacteria bacterium CG11_big_fil_rev_8_21_14_0_20_49_13]|nr:MAG: hypothetical protein COV46_08475 [Deltaproteobacteria bacterium CG11_big_fil_rev_8_21_14_0_20_49_13]